MTAFWPAGLPIEVACDETHAPLRLIWAGQALRVQAVLNRWRVDAWWWRARVWREYFLVIAGDGLLLLLFHDLDRTSWHLQRVYD
jgi:hypothetical protein